MSEELKESTEIAVQNGQTNNMVPATGTPITRCPTNLNLSTNKGRALAVNGASPANYEVTADKPLHIVATHWLILPDGQVDEETGEVREFPRVVLYDAEGKTFRTTGIAAPAKIKLLSDMYDSDAWARGIPLLVTVLPSKKRKGAHWHDIRVDIDAIEE